MWLILAAVSVVPAAAQTASASAAEPGPDKPRPELALTYTYLHANAPPGGCECFSMNGGEASFAYPVSHSFSVVGEAGAVTAGNVDSTGLDLTLSHYLAGGRYSLRRFSRFTPFAQILIGVAHASGDLAPDQLHIGSSTAFAMAAGGGLDLNLTHHVAVRLFQTDYLLTLLNNRVNDHQNNFRFSTGIVFHFGKS
jgi:peptidoglycan-associated lipoprotein